MNNKELKEQEKTFYEIITGYSTKENLPMDKLLEVFGEETTKIINNKIDPSANIVYELDEDKKSIYIYNENVLVVSDEEMTNTPEERIFNISLTDAQKVDKKAKIDDVIKTKINLISLNKSKNPTLKTILKIILQSLMQGIKLLHKKIIFEKYSQKINEQVKVQFTSKNKDGSWNVKLADDITTAFLPSNSVSSKRLIKPGQYIDVIIESVEEDSKLSQIRVSLDSPLNVKNELIANIPEISEGLIEIVDIYRKPGERTKVSVKKADKDNLEFDLYGSIIGPNSSRINTIVKQLGGERIDIVQYDDDIKEYIINAMSPGKVIDVVPKNGEENNKAYYVIVTDASLTPAIGKKGINATLASNLTGTYLDVINMEKADQLGLVYSKDRLADLLKNEGYKKKTSFNKRPARKNNKYVKYDEISFDMESFDSDVAAFESNEQDSEKYYDFDFNELFEKHEKEKNNQQPDEESAEKVDELFDKVKQVKNDAEDYKKAKKVLKDFKVDDDLASYGLDSNFDLSDIDEDEWN